MGNSKLQRSGPYTISSVRKTENSDSYVVTVAREGRTVNHVRVVPTPSAFAYYNESAPSERTGPVFSRDNSPGRGGGK